MTTAEHRPAEQHLPLFPIPSAPACSGSVGAGRTGAIGAGAVVTGIGAVGALTRVVITARAGAIGANTDCTRVGTVGALAGSAPVRPEPTLPEHAGADGIGNNGRCCSARLFPHWLTCPRRHHSGQLSAPTSPGRQTP